MLYNQHYAGGTPGAVAGIDWMETTIQYLLQYIPEEKFYAGLGAYGYSWLVDGGGGTSIHIKRCLWSWQRSMDLLYREMRQQVSHGFIM